MKGEEPDGGVCVGLPFASLDNRLKKIAEGLEIRHPRSQCIVGLSFKISAAPFLP